MPRGTLKWERVFAALERQIQQGQLRGKLPSFQKLCDEYGTSLITISRVIKELERRGYVRVKPRSGVFVESALVPHEAATTRPSYLVKRIAFIVPVRWSEPYWSHTTDGILYACEQRNREGRTRWRLEISHNIPVHSGFTQQEVDSGEEGALSETPQRRQRLEELEKRVILELADEVDALIVVPNVLFNPDFYLGLLRRGVRLIIFDSKVSGVPYVASNDRRAAYKGMIFLLLGLDSNKGRFLLRQNSANAEKIPAHLAQHSPLVYLLAEADEFNTIRERISGCQEAMSDATARGYEAPPNWLRLLRRVENVNDYEGEAYGATHALLDELERSGQLGSPHKTRPIAIFTVTDRCALGAYRALMERGYCDWTNPDKESVALLSYDNVWQKLEAYSISSLVQDPFALGKTAAQILFDMPHPATFLQPGNEPADVLLDVGLTQRASTHNIKGLD